MGRIILHLDLDSFYASVEEMRRPEIKGKPIVICVFSGRSEDSGAVSTANYKARELGIGAGMPIARAKMLARGKDVVFLPNDIEHYTEVSDKIMDLLDDEADALEQVSIDEAYLDLTDRCRGDWRAARKVAEEIKSKIKELESLTCSVGIGPNKLVAKMGSKHKKPDGLTVIMEGEVQSFFGNIPVSKLHGIGFKTIEVLDRLGIKNGKDLAGFDFKTLKENFGENKAKKIQEIARGIGDTKVEQRLKKQVSKMATLKEDARSAEQVFGRMNELLAELSRKTAKKGARFRTVSIITIDTNLRMQTKSETIPESESVLGAVHVFERLMKDFFKENDGVVLRRIGVRVSNLTYKKIQATLKDFGKFVV
ncbi:hypothetical protein A3K63_04700 [Candidatus Micrarchaeota archaeon RBG_16_49_10]|nr:MAG: hypothetical protein A3K63_04700 [Candidatus Micrarchaeota archaeon RBG_16_49_10]